ncbi:intradiol ring-cleavage dioxygenase [Nonomuraea mangrovi]|uniref:Intradiol ring-cleavage dioxygenase n=1 Tax=Nonomuraea mangrovi TaxID=2316207 RepID=A0ABW4SM27_9ACTN
MHADDNHDRGLAFDLPGLLDRRGALGLLGGAVLLGAVGCAGEAGSSAARAAAGEIPDETAGPYPGDGSNGPNILTQSGVVRQDIRAGFGSGSATAEGVPLTIELTVTDDGAPYRGAAVYLWHCDREGRYSMYSEGVTGETYLRGVQEADANGLVRFTSVFPGAYAGRWPHVHFEVYGSLAEATKAGEQVKTSQLAFPEDVCTTVYATSGYEQSVTNLTRSSLEDDNVFGDGYESQLATLSGDVSGGYTARLAVPV